MNSIEHYVMMIGGAAVTGRENRTILNPFDRTVVGSHPLATREDLDAAVAAAREALPSWSAKGDAERQAVCVEVAKIFEAHAEELALLITREQGKPVIANGFGSQFEVGGCVGWSMATSQLALPDVEIDAGAGTRVVQKRIAKGVVGSITPWNWPLLIAAWHLVPALRAGNCVVIKPSPFTPLSTLRAVELLNTVLPAGVLNVVTGDADIGAALSTHPGIDKIIFTGSTATGKRVMASAANMLADCTLELGGNDAAIVLPGAPVDAMAQGLFFGSFINAGQTCGAIKRIYVSDDQHDALVDALAGIAAATTVGDGRDEATDMGPVQNEPQFDKVRRLTADAAAGGARLATGGERVGDGFALRPAILGDCRQDMAIVREEQFGPALPLVRYGDLDEAINLANDSEFGLCASVWGTDASELQRVASVLEAGTVYINTHAELNPMVPFGGLKSSGIGVQFGEEGLRTFTDSKILYQRMG